jgi:hypothetical protein
MFISVHKSQLLGPPILAHFAPVGDVTVISVGGWGGGGMTLQIEIFFSYTVHKYFLYYDKYVTGFLLCETLLGITVSLSDTAALYYTMH